MSPLFPKTRRSTFRRRAPWRYAAPALLLAATPLAVPASVAAAPSPQAGPFAYAPGDTLRLRNSGDGTLAADLAMPRSEFHRVKRGWRSDPIDTSGFSMVGLTWTRNGQEAPAVHVRTRTGDDRPWSAWKKMEAQEDQPSVSEGSTRDGTAPLWTGKAEDLQVALIGPRPEGMKLAVLAPTVTAADRRVRPVAPKTQVRPTTAPEPAIVQRSGWGANEAWREKPATRNWTIKQVQIHHTAGSNSYSRSEVPALLRGIYRYHTHSLGWSDLGYNFLIDQWGRIWVGRGGGYRLPIRGAHTLGFNHMSVGISVIGNYQSKDVPREVIRSIITLSAWKLDPYKRNPEGTVVVESRGSDRYPSGRRLTLPVMQGHRDTNETACPGAKLYAQLDFIRWRTAQRVRNYS